MTPHSIVSPQSRVTGMPPKQQAEVVPALVHPSKAFDCSLLREVKRELGIE